MKKSLFVLLGILVLAVSMSASNVKTKTKKGGSLKTIKQTRSVVLSQFSKNSIVDGTKSTGTVRRWYLYNEGTLGSSHTILGSSQYTSADIGYSTYIRSIESLFGGMSLMAGTEISVPLYLSVSGKSNILNDHRALEAKEREGLAGYGVQVPLMIGFEYQGFYMIGLVGYTWLFMKDTYSSTARGENPTVETQYDGLIYGGGIGYKISNVVNIGIRYTTGNVTNRRDQTKFDSRATAENLDNISITQRDKGRDLYGINYQRFYAFISWIF